jgi:O-antigen ligase
MMAARVRTIVLGGVLLACLIEGGGTTPGLARDQLLECLIFFVAVIFLDLTAIRFSRGVLLGVAAVGVLALVAVAPLPESLRQSALLARTLGPAAARGTVLLTTDANRTVQSLLFFFALLCLFVLFGTLGRQALKALAPFYWCGIALNAIAAAVQFSTAGLVAEDGSLPGRFGAGFFINPNHFSALLYTAIPLLVALAARRRAVLLPICAIIVICLEAFGAGSRAGIFFAFALIVLSLVLVPDRARDGASSARRILAFVAVAAVVATAVYVDAGSILRRDVDARLGRYEFARNTIAGIGEALPFGYGYGTFPLAYQIFEPASDILDRYVNHAHDDYLEAVFEGGLPAVLGILLYLGMLARAAARATTPLKRAALLSLVALLLHSLVDYPLRTFAVGAVFVFLNALLLHEEGAMAGVRGESDAAAGRTPRRSHRSRRRTAEAASP